MAQLVKHRAILLIECGFTSGTRGNIEQNFPNVVPESDTLVNITLNRWEKSGVENFRKLFWPKKLFNFQKYHFLLKFDLAPGSFEWTFLDR